MRQPIVRHKRGRLDVREIEALLDELLCANAPLLPQFAARSGGGAALRPAARISSRATQSI
ncbi:hypothetical protein DB346_02295 [Verrucomicrobia bacterium LW23]|nr:hypothetical protein DB346_02295 [Verrucomicrobia bacterium LW23]